MEKPNEFSITQIAISTIILAAIGGAIYSSYLAAYTKDGWLFIPRSAMSEPQEDYVIPTDGKPTLRSSTGGGIAGSAWK